MRSLSDAGRLRGATVFLLAFVAVGTIASGCGSDDPPAAPPGGSAGTAGTGGGNAGTGGSADAGTGGGGTGGSSAGTSGSGGTRDGSTGSSGTSGSTGAAGTAGTDGGPDGGGRSIDCVACREECSNFQGTDYVKQCFQGDGFAQEGGAAGVPLAKLCSDVFDCMYRNGTGCGASGDPFSCYCGDAGDCLTQANGVCKELIEWAAELPTPGDFALLGSRFADTVYAVGRAKQLLDCYQANCQNECLRCGNGTVDPGEECDPAASAPDPLCLSNCKRAVCGNGTVESPVEQCDPKAPGSSTALCTETCRNRTATCGDGFITPPERCEPPNTATCGSNCRLTQPECGNGSVEAGEVCDEPGGNNYAALNCGGIWDPALTPPGGSRNACRSFEYPGCQPCLDGRTECTGLTCETLSGNAQDGSAAGQPKANLCRKVLDCVYDTGCDYDQRGINTRACYCGTAADCSSGANGACKAVIEAAAEATDFTMVNARLDDPAFAAGKALRRINCQGPCYDSCGVR
jgi:hypothetical protein